ncbi:NAD-dependent epimerase/dehydratase family protein [Paracnuella aquatica]|uniref:NAD-dependent epimerase/dehydratase family protein n=1 Tax=Paracnuella aquatica TaxID=2268757 RepID=UPI000DEFD010|nr:NAD-dependent epimerase/dehydratase family protein [Paracnuella aquatica]RPD48930.1 NAD-dependent epimerase/dehydratase family protein [Paracnuella aquatica]
MSSQPRKHYLVTGGAGFIGSHVCAALLRQPGVRVSCLDSFEPFYRREIKDLNLAPLLRNEAFQLLELNLDTLTVDQLQAALPDPVHTIIHLAARAGVRPSILNPLSYQQTNVIGTQVLLDFAVKTGVQKFVFASSSSVYGVNGNLPWNEEERLQPISPYAMTKLAGEGLGHVYSHLYKLPFIALRFFTVYGPGQRPDLAIHKFTKAIINGEPIPVFGDGSTSRDYTFIDDIVSGILGAVDYEGSLYEIVNLGNHQTVSLQGLIDALEEVIGKKAIINRQPEQPGDVPHTYADVAKAQRLFGYNAGTDLREGLRKFYDWFLANKNVLN